MDPVTTLKVTAEVLTEAETSSLKPLGAQRFFVPVQSVELKTLRIVSTELPSVVNLALPVALALK